MASLEEAYRQAIVLPLDDAAERAVRRGVIDELTQVRLVSLSDDGLFTSLQHSQLFDEIMSRCKSVLDEYETDVVEPLRVPGVLGAIEHAKKRTFGQRTLRVLEELHDLARTAIVSSRPLFFVL